MPKQPQFTLQNIDVAASALITQGYAAGLGEQRISLVFGMMKERVASLQRNHRTAEENKHTAPNCLGLQANENKNPALR